MAGEAEESDFLGDKAEEGSISREARNARGGLRDQKEDSGKAPVNAQNAWWAHDERLETPDEKDEEAWVREALRQGLEDVLVKRSERMPQTQKATLASLWGARKILGASMSIKLSPVIVEDPKDLRLWLTTKTETSETTKSPTSE